MTRAEIEGLRWRVLLRDVVSETVTLSREGNNYVGLCPFHSERTPSFTLYPDEHYHCFGCGEHGDVFAFVMQRDGVDFLDALAALACRVGTGGAGESARHRPRRTRAVTTEPTSTPIAVRIWQATQPDSGPIHAYLRARGLSGDVPVSLRFHPALRYEREIVGEFPAMVGPLVNAKDEVVGIHRTYLQADGSAKADVLKPKMFLGAVRGAAIRLCDDVGETIAITEGIETGLAVQEATGLPTWVAGSAGNLRSIELPASVIRVYICADHDENGVGQREAELAAANHFAAGRLVFVVIPSQSGDWLDVLNGQGPQAVTAAFDQAMPREPARETGETGAPGSPTAAVSAARFTVTARSRAWADVADLGCFDRSGKFIPAYLGEHLRTESGLLLGPDGRLWRYFGGVYRPDGDAWAKQRVCEIVADRFRRSQIDEVLAYLRAQLPSPMHAPPADVINVQNGLLDWKTGTLRPHSPEVLSTNQIPVVWNPDATAPRTLQFFDEVLPPDAVGLVQELFGYALFPGNPMRKAVMLLGPGGNGKSVLLRLLSRLLGADNVASVPLQALGEDRFSAADLYGKLANICGDLDARAIERTDLFKQLTGGDTIRAQHKFLPAFTFTSYALPLFSANEPPRTADQTNAWFDRWIIVPMPHIFESTERMDVGLDAKLAAELDGLLVLAVTGLQRLMNRGWFHFPPSVERARQGYRETLDTVRAFVVEQCHLTPDGWVDKAELYRRYKNWCKDQGRFALAASSFNTNLTQAYAARIGSRPRQGRRGWAGLAAGPAPTPGDDGDDGDALPVHPKARQDGGDSLEGGGGRPEGDAGDEGDAVHPYVFRVSSRVGSSSPSSPSTPSELSEPAGLGPCRSCGGRVYHQAGEFSVCSTCHPPVRPGDRGTGQ